jgi:hypothetical protein
MLGAGGVEFAAGGAELDAAGVLGVDAAVFAGDDPEPPLEAASAMIATRITARMTVRIGCRRNQLFFGLAAFAGASS